MINIRFILLTGNKIYDCFYDDYNKHKAFMYSHTYSGNPLGASLALEVLNIFKEDRVLKTIEEKGKFLNEKLKLALENHKNVVEIRSIGMINAIEIVKDKKSKEAFNSQLRIGYNIYKEALKRGLLLRPLEDVLYFKKPYIVSREDMNFMIEITKESIEYILGK